MTVKISRLCNNADPPRLRDMMLHHDIAAQKLTGIMRVPECKGKQDAGLRGTAEHHNLFSDGAFSVAQPLSAGPPHRAAR